MIDRLPQKFWPRAVCFLVALAGLALLFYHLPMRQVWNALTHADFRWVSLSLAIYGFLFLPAAWRWHIALQSTGCDRGAGNTLRFTMIGHFFYNLLAGAVGGDAAKSALYARKTNCRFEGVLAAAPLDRLMGLAGLILFSIAIVACTFGLNGFAPLGKDSMDFHAKWICVGCIATLPLLWWLFRLKGDSLLTRFLSSFRLATGKLARAPRQVIPGVICGILVQIALSAVIAVSLRAVAHEALPWARFLWTFPLIVMASGLPITFAGFGTREGAAIFLFGFYGVPRTEAVAASLLYIAASLFWAVLGGGILWWETRRAAHPGDLPRNPMDPSALPGGQSLPAVEVGVGRL